MLSRSTASRENRSLANLDETASTSRVLNLSYISRQHREDPLYKSAPFFIAPALNKGLVLKHTLRPHERHLFTRQRRVATKLILPFDAGDLRLGGRSVLIGQVGYDQFAREHLGDGMLASNRDYQVLRYLDEIPSLDPFLIREQLVRHGIRPAPCYLKISPRDINEMTQFANDEVRVLVDSAFSGGGAALSLKLTEKILSDRLDAELEPLRTTFRMSEESFADGIFGWRGFLYFKWRQTALQDEIKAVLEGLKTYRPIGVMDSETRAYLETARPRLAQTIIKCMVGAHRTLSVYDRAYQSMTRDSNPGLFQKFLLNGPSIFFELGEQMGILSHISAFWSYRFGGARQYQPVSPIDYADTLIDFEDSLAMLENA